MLPKVSVGSVMLFEGQWKMDSKYGEQFAITDNQEQPPSKAYGQSGRLNKYYKHNNFILGYV